MIGTNDSGGIYLMKVICYGDSNTFGYDPRGYFGDRYMYPWPEILKSKVGWDVMNQGENGREVPKTIPTFPDDTELLIIMLGTNDLLQLQTPENICKRMTQLLKSLMINGEKILLIAPVPMKLGVWVQNQEQIENSKTLAKHYRELAKSLGIRFADAGQWNIPLAYDGVHFTEEGHIAFTEGLINYLNKGDSFNADSWYEST
jgi:lysophospholipase L1-like esterase